MNVLTATIPSTCGHVTLNGEPLDRRWRRKMAYVMQKDAFYASLTLRETLTVKINVTSIEYNNNNNNYDNNNYYSTIIGSGS